MIKYQPSNITVDISIKGKITLIEHIGPDATMEMERRRINNREYFTLYEHWWNVTCGLIRWNVLIEDMIRNLIKYRINSGLFYVTGLGIIGGIVLNDSIAFNNSVKSRR